jgi:hypothetical protein
VTADSDFYKGRKPENGLAEDLVSEIASENASIFAYQALSKLVEHLAPSVPPHDAEDLKRRIAQATKDAMEQRANVADFTLGELTEGRVAVAPIGTPLNLLATFDLTYSLINKLEQYAQARLNPELTANGSCLLSGPGQSISYVRLDRSAISWIDPRGNIVTLPQFYLYYGSHAPSAGTAPFSIGGTLAWRMPSHVPLAIAQGNVPPSWRAAFKKGAKPDRVIEVRTRGTHGHQSPNLPRCVSALWQQVACMTFV